MGCYAILEQSYGFLNVEMQMDYAKRNGKRHTKKHSVVLWVSPVCALWLLVHWCLRTYGY